MKSLGRSVAEIWLFKISQDARSVGRRLVFNMAYKNGANIFHI